MNYQLIHDAIIERAKNREIIDSEYFEIHHILPKSMGGSDDQSNLVKLSAKEHYVIHHLLYKIHRNSKMALAWHMMTATNDVHERKYTITAIQYEQIKKHYQLQPRELRNHPEQKNTVKL